MNTTETPLAFPDVVPETGRVDLRRGHWLKLMLTPCSHKQKTLPVELSINRNRTQLHIGISHHNTDTFVEWSFLLLGVWGWKYVLNLGAGLECHIVPI